MTGGETVRIDRLAAGGDGVGRLADGRVVFIPRTAPGDLVRTGPIRRARRLARARVAALLEPGSGRVEPACPHYTRDECGGCQLQHLTAEAQVQAKSGFVADALRRIAHRETGPPPVEAAPEGWRYRTRIAMAVGRDGRIGLHPVDRPGAVFDLDDCPITALPLMRLWRSLAPHRGLLPSDTRRLLLRLDEHGGRHVIAEVSGTVPWSRAPDLAGALERAGEQAVLWWHPEGGAARTVAASGEAYPATVFQQVYPVMAARVRAHALRRLAAGTGSTVWDLYAGTGDTSLALVAAGAKIASVEQDRRAVALAEVRLRGHLGIAPERPLPPAVDIRSGRAETLVSRLPRPDLIITNPPRTGMAEGVTLAVGRGGAHRVVYISCDPATLARDVSRLGSGWRLADVHAFDLFPQTAHVETVAVLERAS